MQEGNIIGFCRQAKLFEWNLFSKKYLFFQMVKPGGLDYLHSPSVRLLADCLGSCLILREKKTASSLLANFPCVMLLVALY